MKTVYGFCIAVWGLLMVGCQKPDSMLTRIEGDGSCVREFCAVVDTAFLCGSAKAKDNPFPVRPDSGWVVSWQVNGGRERSDFPVKRAVVDSVMRAFRSGKAVMKCKDGLRDSMPEMRVVLRRKFATVASMDSLFRFKDGHSWQKFRIRHELNTQFRWFYTWYTYTETFPKLKIPNGVPLSDYMTADEARYWFTGQPDLLEGMNGMEAREFLGNLENRYEQWFNYSIWKVQYGMVVKHWGELKNPPVSVETFKTLCDTIYEKQGVDKQNFDMGKVLDSYFKTRVFAALWNRYEDVPENDEEENAYALAMGYGASFNYRLLMPGEIVDKGTGVQHGDTLQWRLTTARLVTGDYVVRAQSRRANVWAFVLTGLVVLVAAGSVLWPLRRFWR